MSAEESTAPQKSDTPSRTAPAESSNAPKLKDIWDKASVVSSFLSSVVIATVGIIVTASMQRTQIATSTVAANAQIEIQKYNADRENRLNQSKLTTELLDHLLSKDVSHRQLALIALRETVEPQMADSITAALARNDSDPSIRVAAIKQLQISKSAIASDALHAIANDPSKNSFERQLAAEIGLPDSSSNIMPVPTTDDHGTI